MKKQTSKSPPKPARKRRSKPQRRFMTISRKLKKTRTKLKRSVRRQRKQAAKQGRNFLRRLRKLPFFPGKPAPKRTKPPVKSKAGVKTRNNPKSRAYSLRMLLLTAMVSGIFGIFGGHLWAQENGGIFG